MPNSRCEQNEQWVEIDYYFYCIILAHLFFILLFRFSHLFYNFNKLRASEACRQTLSTFCTHQLHSTSWRQTELTHTYRTEKKKSYINCNFGAVCCLFFHSLKSLARKRAKFPNLFYSPFIIREKRVNVMKVFMWINISLRYNLSLPYQSL